MTQADVSDLEAILSQRGARYGVFRDHALIAQTLKAAMRGDTETLRDLAGENAIRALRPKFEGMAPDQCEALEMIQHKIARILNGDPDYADSWDDIAGYAKLVSDRLKGVSR